MGRPIVAVQRYRIRLLHWRFSFAAGLTQGPNPNAASTIAGNSIATLLLGGGSGSMLIDSKDGATQSRYFGAFIQDDWKVSRKLTINMGLRYDLDIPRTERYDRMETFNTAIPSPLAAATGIAGLRGGTVFVGVNGAGRRQYDPQYKNFDPRFGFAFQVDTNTVIRGGYGIFFAPSLRVANATIGNEGFSASTDYNSSPNGLTQSLFLSNPFPNGFNKPVGNSQGLLTGIGALSRIHSPEITPSPTWKTGISTSSASCPAAFLLTSLMSEAAAYT